MAYNYSKASKILGSLCEKLDHRDYPEVIPSILSEIFRLNTKNLEALHNFMKNNELVRERGDFQSDGYRFTIYNYINHASLGKYNWKNCHGADQPFVPTWLISSWLLANLVKDLGFKEFVDVGSGYGSLPYCATLLGMRGIGIERQPYLIEIQETIKKKTGIEFELYGEDSKTFDFKKLQLENPLIMLYGVCEPQKLAKEIKSKITFCLWDWRWPWQFERPPKERNIWYEPVFGKEISELIEKRSIKLPTHWGDDITFSIAKYKH